MSETILTEESEHKLSLRHLTEDDYADVKALWDAIYAGLNTGYPEKNLERSLKPFLMVKFVLKTTAKSWLLRFR